MTKPRCTGSFVNQPLGISGHISLVTECRDREQAYNSRFSVRECLLLLDITEIVHHEPHPHSYRRVIPPLAMSRHPTKSYTSQFICRFLGSQNTSPKLPTRRGLARRTWRGMISHTLSFIVLSSNNPDIDTVVLLAIY